MNSCFVYAILDIEVRLEFLDARMKEWYPIFDKANNATETLIEKTDREATLNMPHRLRVQPVAVQYLVPICPVIS